MKKIVIAGGSGQVGTVLARHFAAKGDEVVILSRKVAESARRSGTRRVGWDGATAGPWVEDLEAADVLINLAGRSVDCRYGAKNRREIFDSRLKSTTVLGEAVAKLRQPPKLWMNAGTATIYRHALDRPMDEETGEIGNGEVGAPDSWRFSFDVASAWEAAFAAAPVSTTRKVVLRSAMTMSPDRGGVFDVLSRLVRLGLGGRHASGEQFVSWIHETDFVRAVDFLIDREDFEGPVNLSSPHPLPNREFMKTLRQAWGWRVGLPTARWMLEIGAMLLRTETELILKSRRVAPGRLQAGGFEFVFPEWKDAAAELVARSRRGGTRRLPLAGVEVRANDHA